VRTWEENQGQVTAPPYHNQDGVVDVGQTQFFLKHKGFQDEILDCLQGMVAAFLISLYFLRI